VALVVGGEGWWPPPTSTTTGTVGLLIIALGDGVSDVAGPQRRPVGAAAVSLVPGQVIGTYSGPTAATRPGHPHGVHQPYQLAGVGVLAWGEAGGQIPAAAVADGMQLGGQPAS
jgi:hypothetical protein